MSQQITRSQVVTDSKKIAYLEAYVETMSHARAAAAVGVSRESHYYWRRTDAAYNELYIEAEKAIANRIEAEARRRAVEGWDEETAWGSRRRYSDELLKMILAAEMPEKYGRTIEANGEITHHVKVVAGVDEAKALPDASNGAAPSGA